VVDVQATSKNPISKTRTPVVATCLITDRKGMCGASLMQPAARDGGHRAVSTMGGPIQKCPELIPASPPGAYDGRGKWAAVDVVCCSVDSVTTPSWGDEAQAESSHAITKTSIPHHAASLFTKPNLRITEPDATTGTRGLMPKERATKKFCAEREARV
jgi:hypothetical protein